jgi:hypothetical protein
LRNTAGLRGPVKHIVLALLILTMPAISIAQAKNPKDLVKTADKYFEKQKYKDALTLYSQLVANFPKDANYNYKYGACLLFADEDKSKGLQYLEYAVSRSDVDAEAFFFLGKGYHFNYSFAKAAKNYEKYKSLGKSKMLAKYDVDGHLRQAKNGKSLLKNLTDIVVLQKQKLNDADFFKVYDLSEFGGKLVLKPEEFKTSYEKEEGIESILYLPKDASRIYFSSVDSEEGDRDLYYADRTAKGWSSKKKLSATINTEFDEDFAFVHPEANVLYFSSKGHNSLGGYDIFKSEFNEAAGTWSKPENMDFAINTPDDDFLFITDKEQKKAYFSSKRSSVQGEVHVYRINMQRIPLDIAMISGIFESNTTKSANIQVKDIDRNVIVGEYQTDPGSGKYLIQLPQTGNFQFLVDYKGSEVAHAGEVSLKNQDPLKPLLQEMKIENQGTVDEKLIIRNLIDVEVEDDDPIIAEIFKQRAQLNVTSQEQIERVEKEQPVEGPTVSVSEKAKEESSESAETSSEEISDSEEVKKDPKFDLIGDDYTKEDIVKVAMNNAMSLEKDAKILEKEAEIATNVAADKRSKARQKRDEVKLAYSKIDTTVKTTANAEELARIRYMEREAEDLEDEARVSDELAEDLKDRAYQKKSGMAIAMSYANQIQNSIDDNNRESSLQKFNQLKEYVEEQKQEKSSINTMSENIESQLKQKRAVLRNQKRYQKRLEDQLFEKEKQYMEMNPDPENPDESAKKLAEELKRDRINVDRVKARTERSIREVEMLRSELQVVKEIVDDVNTSEEIAQLASETPDAQVIPDEVAVPDITEDLKEASESDLSLTEEEKAEGVSEEDLAQVSEDGEIAPGNNDQQTEDQRPQSLNSLKSDEHTDYEKPSGGRFHPETINAQLEDPESQSLAILMRSGYNNAYQNDFLDVAEEQDDLVRTAKMKVLNEDWVSDIQAEYDYLDSLERSNAMPENTEAIEERKSSLRKLLNVKKQQLDAVEKTMNTMAAERGQDPEELLAQIKEGKAIQMAQYEEEQAARAEEEQELATADTPDEAQSSEDQEQVAESTGQTETTVASEQAVEDQSEVEETPIESSEDPLTQSLEEDSSESESTQTTESEDTGDNNPEESTTEEGNEIAESAQSTANDFPDGDIQTNEDPQLDESTQSEETADGAEAESGVESRQEQAQVKDPEKVKELVLEGDEEAIVQRINPAERFVSSEATSKELETKVQPIKKLTQERVSEKKREIGDKQEEITQLETEITEVKGLFKKRKREPLEQELKFKQQEAAMLETQLSKIEKESDAVVELAAVDVYDQGSSTGLSPREMASMNAQELQKMAADTAQYAEDLRALAENTKKKKEKQRLLKQAEVYDERAKQLEAEASKTEELVKELEEVEEQVASIRENTKLELPASEAELDPEQSAEIRNSPEYIKYNTERTEGERKIKRAEVLYQQALKMDLDANMKEAEAEELATQIEATQDPEEKKVKQARVEELRKEVQKLRAEAGNKKKEAHQQAIQGNKQRNAAIASVMSMDVSQRDAIAALETDRKPDLEGKTSFTPEEFSDIVQGKLEIPDVLTTAIYKKVEFNESLYNDQNPIPVNSKVPKGLIYMVQVGAFRLKISQDVFKGFAPVRGESAPGGLTRYMAGLFKKINAANLAKNEIRAIGYSDAFVVAYFNGERITLSRAREIEGAGPELADQGQIAEGVSAGSTGPEGSVPPAQVFKADEIKGLYYTVQVGAFSREVPPSAMFNLSPLVSRQVSGLVKYTCGIYSSREEASQAKDRIRAIGISDAFVTIFHNGQPISSERALEILDEQGDAAFASDVPVSTGSSGSGGGAATGVEYQVQVGAYAEEVPVNDAQIILGLSNLGLDVKSDGGMTKYVVGGYKTYREANDFKNKVIGQGLSSAFIVAYENGQKIDVARAKELTGD